MSRTVLFDMDGVLLDSQPLHYLADQQTLAFFGISVTISQLECYAGTATGKRFQQYKNLFQINADTAELVKKRGEIATRIFSKEPIAATIGALELLEQLKQHQIKIALASSTELSLIHTILERIGLHQYFTTIISGENVKHGKPAPDIFLLAAQALEESPQNCCVIEDSTMGVLAAHRAGMKMIGYQNKTSGHQDLSLADIVIENFSKLTVDTILCL